MLVPYVCSVVFFFQAEDGIRYLVRSRGLGDVYKRQLLDRAAIGVVDDIFEIDAFARRGSHRKHLVGADAEMTVGQQAVVLPGQAQRLSLIHI